MIANCLTRPGPAWPRRTSECPQSFGVKGLTFEKVIVRRHSDGYILVVWKP